MQKRTIGSSDLSVPVICLGTMNWGQQNTEIQAHEQLSYGVDERGLYFIDTAEIYPIPPDASKQGRTETYIGTWLAGRGKRDDLVIATKIAAAPAISTRDLRDKPRYDRMSVLEAVDGSLKRLQTDYIDLYQIHWPERSTNFFGVRGVTDLDSAEDSTAIEETLSALAEVIKAGKVRYIGLSNETPWGMAEYLRLAREKNLPKIVSIQNQYSLLNRTFEIGLSEFALRENVGLLPYSVLNMGVLSGKYLDGARPEGARFTLYERNGARYNPERAQPVIKRYIELARDNGLDPSQMALAFARQRSFVSSVIIGTTSVEQLKIDADSADLTLSDELMDQIEHIHLEMPDMTH